MTWGIPTDTFLQIHVILSLIGIASGLVVLYGLVTGSALGGLTEIFLLTTILTGVTGFPLPPFGLDPARKKLRAYFLRIGVINAICRPANTHDTVKTA